MSSPSRRFLTSRRVVLALACGALAAVAPSIATAQQQGGGTTGTGAFSGVAVDADGVLQRQEFADPTGQLLRTRLEQAAASLDPNVAKASELRKVSLTRLIKQIDEAVAKGAEPDETMLQLAGLTRIQYVFYYPETKDIVLAGPAEGWVRNA